MPIPEKQRHKNGHLVFRNSPVLSFPGPVRSLAAAINLRPPPMFVEVFQQMLKQKLEDSTQSSNNTKYLKAFKELVKLKNVELLLGGRDGTPLQDQYPFTSPFLHPFGNLSSKPFLLLQGSGRTGDSDLFLSPGSIARGGLGREEVDCNASEVQEIAAAAKRAKSLKVLVLIGAGIWGLNQLAGELAKGS